MPQIGPPSIEIFLRGKPTNALVYCISSGLIHSFLRVLCPTNISFRKRRYFVFRTLMGRISAFHVKTTFIAGSGRRDAALHHLLRGAVT